MVCWYTIPTLHCVISYFDLEELVKGLKKLGDLERMITKASTRSMNLKDFLKFLGSWKEVHVSSNLH